VTKKRTTSAWIQAHPNPVLADASGVGATTLSWSSEGTDAVEVHVGAPDGPLLSRTAGSGSTTTGKWVHDGMVFYLQDVSGDAPLTSEHVLATVTMRVESQSDRSGPKALILLYHRVAEVQPDPWSLCVTPQRFAEHLDVLSGRWNVLRLRDLVRALQVGALPDRAVVITFDDGYADNLHNAKPVLERYGKPATVFVASGYVGNKREFWWDELERVVRRDGSLNLDLYRSLHRLLQRLTHTERCQMLDGFREWAGIETELRRPQNTLSATELAELARGDLIDIGSHTVTHALLEALPEAQQRAEIVQSKAGLEEILGWRVDHFAYPYGRYSEATIRILRSAGFACACTTNACLVDKYSDRFQLPRLTVEDWGGEEFARRLSDWYGSQTRRVFEEVQAADSQADMAPSPAKRRTEVLDPTPDQHLERAERVRLQVEAGLRAFQAQFDSALRAYRSQRAWQAMLLLRKAYTLLFQKRDVASFLKWVLRFPLKSTNDLVEYELSFPEVDSYLPPELKSSFRAASTQPDDFDAAARRVPTQTKYDLVVLPVFEFDFRFQRPQQLAVQFARNGHRVFWVSPSRRIPASAADAYELVGLRENLWEVRPRGDSPSIYAGSLSMENSAEVLESLRHLYRDWAIAESAVIIELPFWRSIGLGLRETFGASVVFDCMDDWQSMPVISEFNRREERALVTECDLLVLTARQLSEKYAACARRSVLAPNAADFGTFGTPVHAHDSLVEVPKPIVGYFGAIADWFDYDLFHDVVTSRPQYSFVLVGGLGLEREVCGDEIARFRELPNVFLMGHRPYNELPSYLRQFDACIIPFVINDVTRATDPVKVYEYLSQGKPVVATAMPELSDRSSLIYLAKDAADFARKLDLALSENDPELKRRRSSYASRNTWCDRLETIDAAVRGTFPLVSILIVTYNSQDYIQPCLESVIRNTSYPSYEILIVDNGSSDGTVQLLKDHAEAEPRIRVITLPDNKGFAAANNIAARLAKGDYLIFLNIDTMVTPGWVGRLVRHHQNDPSAGVIVPVTNWAGNEARINTDYANYGEMEDFALELAQKNMGASIELDVAPFFCALIPREVWTQAGELDERFETGMFEDDDYSIRVRQLSRRIIAAEDCFVHHFGRGSFSKMSSTEYRRIFDQNLRRFEEKWAKPWTQHKFRAGIRPEHVQHNPAHFNTAPTPRRGL
jgi:GT2 family glycosyltransferase/peptidoglycan/xylan/chitin deacetylase (PgdA/CDA1 family)/glycosyltransferase involved in cell wall biosynthesis